MTTKKWLFNSNKMSHSSAAWIFLKDLSTVLLRDYQSARFLGFRHHHQCIKWESMRELSENLGPGGDHQVDKWTSGDWFPRNEIDLSWSQPAVVGLQSANGWFAKSCLTKDEGLSLLIKKIFSLLITVQSIFLQYSLESFLSPFLSAIFYSRRQEKKISAPNWQHSENTRQNKTHPNNQDASCEVLSLLFSPLSKESEIKSWCLGVSLLRSWWLFICL